MIILSANYSGAELAHSIFDDDEEMAYFMKELAGMIIGQEAAHAQASLIKDYLSDSESMTVARCLRAMADALDEDDSDA